MLFGGHDSPRRQCWASGARPAGNGEKGRSPSPRTPNHARKCADRSRWSATDRWNAGATTRTVWPPGTARPFRGQGHCSSPRSFMVRYTCLLVTRIPSRRHTTGQQYHDNRPTPRENRTFVQRTNALDAHGLVTFYRKSDIDGRTAPVFLKPGLPIGSGLAMVRSPSPRSRATTAFFKTATLRASSRSWRFPDAKTFNAPTGAIGAASARETRLSER